MQVMHQSFPVNSAESRCQLAVEHNRVFPNESDGLPEEVVETKSERKQQILDRETETQH